MEEEAGSAPGGYRYSMMSKISSYRRDFEQLRKDLVRLNAICRVDRFVVRLRKIFIVVTKDNLKSHLK